MIGLTDRQAGTVMDMTRQLPRLKFVALWGALTLTFAFPAQVFAAPGDDHHRNSAEGRLADHRLHRRVGQPVGVHLIQASGRAVSRAMPCKL